VFALPTRGYVIQEVEGAVQPTVPIVGVVDVGVEEVAPAHDRDPGGIERRVAEEGTVTWYAFKISETSYGILDTFETEDARTAHLNGQIPAALGQVAGDLLACDPEIKLIDLLAVK